MRRSSRQACQNLCSPEYTLAYLVLVTLCWHPLAQRSCRRLALLLLHLLKVELELAALQHIAVAATTLTGARGNACVEAAGAELVIQESVQLAANVSLLQLPADMVALRLGSGLLCSQGLKEGGKCINM